MKLRQDFSCRELVELITSYLDDSLGRGDRRRFERHIEGCPNCTSYLEQMRTTIRLTGTLTEADVPPAGRDALLAAFREWNLGR